MKTTIAKFVLITCLFAVFSCKKADTNTNSNNAGPANNHQTTNCQVATEKGSNGDNFYYYNSNYQLTALAQYDSTGKNELDTMTFQYNSAGQLVTVNNYNPGATSPQNTGTFIYNSGGMLVEYDQFFGGVATVNTYDVYATDSKGNIIIDSTYSFATGSPVLDSVADFSYDGYGNMTNVKTYNSKGVLQDHSMYSYDNETNCFNNLPLAFRIVYFQGEISYCSNYNNISAITDYGAGAAGHVILSVSYTYNSQGLPLTAAAKFLGLGPTNNAFTYTCH